MWSPPLDFICLCWTIRQWIQQYHQWHRRWAVKNKIIMQIKSHVIAYHNFKKFIARNGCQEANGQIYSDNNIMTTISQHPHSQVWPCLQVKLRITPCIWWTHNTRQYIFTSQTNRHQVNRVMTNMHNTEVISSLTTWKQETHHSLAQANPSSQWTMMQYR